MVISDVFASLVQLYKETRPCGWYCASCAIKSPALNLASSNLSSKFIAHCRIRASTKLLYTGLSTTFRLATEEICFTRSASFLRAKAKPCKFLTRFWVFPPPPPPPPPPLLCMTQLSYSSLHKSCHLALWLCSVASVPSSIRTIFNFLDKQIILPNPSRRPASVCNLLLVCHVWIQLDNEALQVYLFDTEHSGTVL